MRFIVEQLLLKFVGQVVDSRLQVGNVRMLIDPKAEPKFVVEIFLNGQWVELCETDEAHMATAQFVGEVGRLHPCVAKAESKVQRGR